MGLFRRQRMFQPVSGGRFEVNLPVETRLGLLSLAEELAEIQSTDRPEVRRLFPTAYTDDPEKDEGYQVFARDQLIEKRREAVEVIRRTTGTDVLTAEELSAWMGILNDFRLVLGTSLDVSEDDVEIDVEAPDVEAQILYRYLGEIVHHMVEALTTSLPEPDADD